MNAGERANREEREKATFHRMEVEEEKFQKRSHSVLRPVPRCQPMNTDGEGTSGHGKFPIAERESITHVAAMVGGTQPSLC